jgi:hypothetical protein
LRSAAARDIEPSDPAVITKLLRTYAIRNLPQDKFFVIMGLIGVSRVTLDAMSG